MSLPLPRAGLRALCSHTQSFIAVPAQAKAAFATSITSSRQPQSPPPQLLIAGLPSRTLARQTLARVAVPIRHASTAPATSSPPPPPSEIPDDNALTWNRFFDLRKRRRYINTGSSVFTSLASVGVLAPILAQQDFDTWGAQISGLDPVIVLGISTFAIAAAGWLCGPTIGGTVFGIWAGRRGWNKLIAEKEKSFYARVKRYRADPASSSPQNPIPDYYGEKIASVKDYRRWLKDQRAFNLKKDRNMI